MWLSPSLDAMFRHILRGSCQDTPSVDVRTPSKFEIVLASPADASRVMREMVFRGIELVEEGPYGKKTTVGKLGIFKNCTSEYGKICLRCSLLKA